MTTSNTNTAVIESAYPSTTEIVSITKTSTTQELNKALRNTNCGEKVANFYPVNKN